MIKYLLLLTVLPLNFAQAWSLNNINNYDPKHLEISEVEVVELDSHLNSEEIYQQIVDDNDSVILAKEEWFSDLAVKNNELSNKIDIMGGVSGLTSKIDLFLRLGRTLYSIVEAGKPVSDTKYNSLHVFPENVESWMEMENWSLPEVRYFQINYKNAYGMNVVKFTYRLNYTHSGTYNGTGKYLSNVQVSPLHVKVVWGYDLNANVEVKNIQNTNTRANPIPAAELLVTYRVKTVLVDDLGSEAHYIRGDGMSKRLE